MWVEEAHIRTIQSCSKNVLVLGTGLGAPSAVRNVIRHEYSRSEWIRWTFRCPRRASKASRLMDTAKGREREREREREKEVKYTNLIQIDGASGSKLTRIRGGCVILELSRISGHVQLFWRYPDAFRLWEREKRKKDNRNRGTIDGKKMVNVTRLCRVWTSGKKEKTTKDR